MRFSVVRAWLGIMLAGGAFGCGPRFVAIAVVPEPADAAVSFDGEPIGTGPTSVQIAKHDTGEHTVRVCGGPGWFCVEHVITSLGPASVVAAAARDQAWEQTVASEQVNVMWPIGVTLDTLPATWTQLIAGLEAAGARFEVLDARSTFARTAWLVLGDADAELRLRTRVTVALAGAAEAAPRLEVLIESEQIDVAQRIKAKVSRTVPGFIEAVQRVTP